MFKFKKLDEPVFLHEDFFYSLNEGYLKPEKILDDPEQIIKIKDAVALLSDFESEAINKGIIEFE